MIWLFDSLEAGFSFSGFQIETVGGRTGSSLPPAEITPNLRVRRSCSLSRRSFNFILFLDKELEERATP